MCTYIYSHTCSITHRVGESASAWRRVLIKTPEERTEEDIAVLHGSIVDMKIKFFETLEKDLVVKLCRHLSIKTYKKSDVVFRQGDEGANFYVMLSGSIGVHIADDAEALLTSNEKFLEATRVAVLKKGASKFCGTRSVCDMCVCVKCAPRT